MPQSGFAAHRLQEAIYAKLEANKELIKYVSGIYDEPPAGALAPYITFGDTTITSFDTAGSLGSQITFDVTVWSSEISQMQTKELMALINDSLHCGDVPVEGFELHRIAMQTSSVTRLSNDTGSFYRGRMSFRATLFSVA